MKHLNLALEKLEDRIAPWGVPSIGITVGAGGNANVGGGAQGQHSGGPSNRSQKSAKSNQSGRSNNSAGCD